MPRIHFPDKPWRIDARRAASVVIGTCFAFATPRLSAAESFQIAALSQDHINWPSLACDSHDQFHLVYRFYSNDTAGFEYGRRTASGWNFELVPGASGYNASLAVDAEGNAHVTYFDPGDVIPLRYASRSTAGWTAETVELAGVPGDVTTGTTSLALDADGRPHVAYSVNGALKYAAKTPSGWVIETVDATGSPELGRYPSLSLASTGDPLISYSDVTGLRLARKQGGSWYFVTIDDNGGLFSSLSIDATGVAHVSYLDLAHGALKYAAQNATAWTTETVSTNAGGPTSLALRPNGEVHIGYQNASGLLEYASKAGGAWTTQMVDASSISGREMCLALDSLGRPGIAYEFHTRYGRTTELRYAQLDALPTDIAGNSNRSRNWFDPVRPSPATGSTADLSFRLAQDDVVTVQLFDVRGRLQAARPPQTYAAGAHSVQWDTGRPRAGVYFVRVKTGSGRVAQQQWTRLR